jgi:hypothetical protein
VLAEHIIMADPRIRQLLRERYDISDPDLIVFDPWTLHGTPEGYEGRRLMQVRVGLCATVYASMVACGSGQEVDTLHNVAAQKRR